MSSGIVPPALAGSATWVALPAATAQRSVPPRRGVALAPLALGDAVPPGLQACRASRPAPAAVVFSKVRRLIRLVMRGSDRVSTLEATQIRPVCRRGGVV